MVTPRRSETLEEARLALRAAEKRRDVAEKGSHEYRAAVREVGQRWAAVRRMLAAQPRR